MNKKYIGYCPDLKNPFKQGEIVIISKGVTVKSMNPAKREFITKKILKIKVHHVLSGQEVDKYHLERYFQDRDISKIPTKGTEYGLRYCTHNPSICWAGSGGYWNEVDVNDILEINGKGE